MSILLLVLSILTGTVNQNTAGAQMQNRFVSYQDPNYGFEIQYPIDWQKLQFAQGITQGSHNMIVNFLSPQSGASQIFRQYLLIETSNLTSATNPSAFSKQELNFLSQSFPDFTPVNTNASSSLAGQNAYSVVFTYKDPIAGVGKAMAIWTLHNSKAYILSYHADSSNYGKYLTAIEKMIRSFKIVLK
jgi:serine/threonine-protein kinase